MRQAVGVVDVVELILGSLYLFSHGRELSEKIRIVVSLTRHGAYVLYECPCRLAADFAEYLELHLDLLCDVLPLILIGQVHILRRAGYVLACLRSCALFMLSSIPGAVIVRRKQFCQIVEPLCRVLHLPEPRVYLLSGQVFYRSLYFTYVFVLPVLSVRPCACEAEVVYGRLDCYVAGQVPSLPVDPAAHERMQEYAVQDKVQIVSCDLLTRIPVYSQNVLRGKIYAVAVCRKGPIINRPPVHAQRHIHVAQIHKEPVS